MKLGISYNIFEGEELFPALVKTLRSHVDYITVCYQNISLKNKPAHPELLSNLKKIEGIDKIFLHVNDLNLRYKQNEVVMRNKGLEECRMVGCTHHISADVDEFYKPHELEYAKTVMEEGNYNCSVVEFINYYKDPTFQIIPHQHHQTCFIQKAEINYALNKEYPFTTDLSRRSERFDKCYVFNPEEITVHHMSFIRKNIRAKLENTSNSIMSIDRFIEAFNKYKVGEKLLIPPDYITRRTKLVDDFFELKGTIWEQHQ